MSARIRSHLRSNIVGYVALFSSATMGTAYATHPGGANTVDSGDIINAEVQTADIATEGVQTADIATDAVESADIATDAVQSPDILDLAILGRDLASDAVTSAKVEPDTLTGEDVADTNSIGSAEIGGLTGADVDDASLGRADLATDAVTTDEIIANGVGPSELQTGAVQSAEIADGTIGTADIGLGAVGASEITYIAGYAGVAANVDGGIAENGAYNLGSAEASCLPGQEVVGGTAYWSPDDQVRFDYELWISEIKVNHADESIRVDGGNDSGVDHYLVPVVHCLAE